MISTSSRLLLRVFCRHLEAGGCLNKMMALDAISAIRHAPHSAYKPNQTLSRVNSTTCGQLNKLSMIGPAKKQAARRIKKAQQKRLNQTPTLCHPTKQWATVTDRAATTPIIPAVKRALGSHSTKAKPVFVRKSSHCKAKPIKTSAPSSRNGKTCVNLPFGLFNSDNAGSFPNGDRECAEMPAFSCRKDITHFTQNRIFR